MFARFGSGSEGRVGWFRVGQVEVTTTTLLVACGVVSMLVWAIYPPSLDPLFFSAPDVREGELWRLVTWPLGEPPSIWAVIGLVFFYIVGHMVEDRTSRKRYALLIAAMTLIPSTLVSLTTLTAETAFAGGLSLFGLAFLVVIAVEDPSRPWFFGIPIWIIAAVIVGIQVLTGIGFRAWGAILLLLLTLAVAVVGTAMIGILSSQLPWVPRLKDAPGPRSRGSRRPKRGRSSGGGTVTQGPWTSPSGFTPTGPTRLEQAELDVLLDKIGSSGIDSLTPQERQRLDELSRRMRGT